MSRNRLLALVIVLIAFGLRMYALDMVWHDFDPSYPHGLAIETLESIQDGRYQDPAPRFYISTIGLPNPVASVLLWMLVALFDRSAYSAIAVSAMLNVLAVAMTFDLARRLFGRSPAVAAALFAATSTWGIFIARGTYVQGLLEFSAVGSAWLVMAALKQARGRLLVGGFAFTAVVIHTYATALGLLGQVVAVTLLAWPATRRMWRALLVGGALLALSLFIQFAPYTLLRPQGALAPEPLKAMGAYPNESPSVPNPFGLHLNLSAFDHALRVVSGRDFENEQMLRTAPEFATQERLGDTRAGIIDALLLVGIFIALARSRRDAGSRMILAWFLVPTLTATVLMAIFKTLNTTYYYMTIASPGGYLLASLPFMALDRLGGLHLANPARRLAIVTAGTALALAGVAHTAISTSHVLGNALFNATVPAPRDMPRGPLRWQMALANVWRAQCDEVNDSRPRYWMVSILESARPVRDGTARSNGDSQVWSVSERGGSCVTWLDGLPPAFGTPIPIQLDDGIGVTLYRSPPILPGVRLFPWDLTNGAPALLPIPGTSVYKQINASAPLQVNLNWTLIDLAVTPSAQPGEWVTVTQAARIDALPDEPHWNWYFAPFVSLNTADDKTLTTVDNAVALQGSMWRPGDIMLSTVRLKVPADAAPGDYKISIGLFDPNQKKNAVFFDPSAPGKPILTLERALTITAPVP